MSSHREALLRVKNRVSAVCLSIFSTTKMMAVTEDFKSNECKILLNSKFCAKRISLKKSVDRNLKPCIIRIVRFERRMHH